MAPEKKKWWNVSPKSGFIHAWEWFILLMVLYNLFSVPYIVSFVASEQCGKDNPLRGILLTLSAACQNGDSYTDILSDVPTPVSLDPARVEFEFYLPCASSIFSLVNIASDCAFFVDILLSFVTGYVPRRSSLPEYNARSIAMNYMRDTFAFDAIATFPWEPAVRVLFPSASDWLGLKLINLVRFFRLIKVQHKLGAYLSQPWVHLGCVAGVYLMCAHCLASLLFFIGRWQVKDLELGAPNDFVGAPWVINECLQFADSSTQYSVAFYWAVTTITTVGYGDIVPNTNTDKVFVMLAMFFSGTLQAAILANVAVAVENLQDKHTQISARTRQVLAALKFHDIPTPLTNRVLNSIEYYASQRFGMQDIDTVQKLPYSLEDNEPVIYRLQADFASGVVSTVHPGIAILSGCSPALLRELAIRWRMMISPPSEPVLVSGSPVMDMYHLVTGTCAAKTSGGIYIGTLAEGSAIGHLDAVLGTPSGADVVAKTYCTMYCLSTMELREMLQAYPEDAKAVRQRALDERSKSHDLTIAKLLSARGTLKNGSRETVERNVCARAAIGTLESGDDADDACELVLLDPMASDITNAMDMLCHEPSDSQASVRNDGKISQGAAGRSWAQSSNVVEAQHRLDGMLHRLQDALATVDAMKTSE